MTDSNPDVNFDRVNAYAMQQGEVLRLALNDGDRHAAVQAFAPHAKMTLDEDELVASLLTSELVAYANDLGMDELVGEALQVTIPMFSAYKTHGRAGEFFGSIHSQLSVLSDANRRRVITTLILATTEDDCDDEDQNDCATEDSNDPEPMVDDDLALRSVVLTSGMTLTWSDDERCWVETSGEHWVMATRKPEVRFIKRRLYDSINEGRQLPGYCEPIAVPNSPSENLFHPEHPDDWQELRRCQDLLSKGSRKWSAGKGSSGFERATSYQLTHFKRTGRWLMGYPLGGTAEWYPDPGQVFATRFWSGREWTGRVRDRSGRESLDSEFEVDG